MAWSSRLCQWLLKPTLKRLLKPGTDDVDAQECRLLVILFVSGIGLLAITGGAISAADLCHSSGCRWGWGLAYAAFIGHLGAGVFLNTLRAYMNQPGGTSIPGEEGVPAVLVGILERLAFATALGLDVSGNQVFVVMSGWIAVKMAANWNRAFPVTQNMSPRATEVAFARRSRGAIAALLAGVVSLAFAVVGGGIIRGVLNGMWLQAVFVGAG